MSIRLVVCENLTSDFCAGLAALVGDWHFEMGRADALEGKDKGELGFDFNILCYLPRTNGTRLGLRSVNTTWFIVLALDSLDPRPGPPSLQLRTHHL